MCIIQKIQNRIWLNQKKKTITFWTHRSRKRRRVTAAVWKLIGINGSFSKEQDSYKKLRRRTDEWVSSDKRMCLISWDKTVIKNNIQIISRKQIATTSLILVFTFLKFKQKHYWRILRKSSIIFTVVMLNENIVR